LTKAGLMKGNSGVPHLVDVECSIIKVHTANMKSFDGISFVEHIRANIHPSRFKEAIKKIESYEPSMFRYNIGKNRYGPSGGFALFHHLTEGIELLDIGVMFDRINGTSIQTVQGDSFWAKAGSWFRQ